jgi:hypothetical protein
MDINDRIAERVRTLRTERGYTSMHWPRRAA